jgi:competence protein ComEC
MASFYLGAILLDREPDAPSALAGAALFILGVSPSSLYDAGFQLSFATVMVLAAALPLFHPFLLRIRHADFRLSGPLNGLAAGAGYYLAGTVVLSTLAQLGSAPLVAHYFNQVSWVGIIANALIVPVVTLLICGGFLLWLMASMSPVIGGTLGTLFISPLLAYVIGVAGYFSHLHRAVLSIPDPGWLLIFAYYTVVAGIIALGYSRQRKPVAVWSEQAVVPISEEGAALMEKTHG